MAKFVYNNAKNASTGYMFFEMNFGYHPRIFFKEDTHPHPKSKLTDKLLAELQKLMAVCRKNIYCASKLQKPAHNKSVKPNNYVPDNKI